MGKKLHHQHTSHCADRGHGSGPRTLLHLSHLLLPLLFQQHCSLIITMLGIKYLVKERARSRTLCVRTERERKTERRWVKKECPNYEGIICKLNNLCTKIF